MATTANFRNGMILDIDGALWAITYFQHVKPGKGGAFVRTRLKNLSTGSVIDRTFRSGDKVDAIRLEKREMQFLYSDTGTFHFMDSETYEQVGLDADLLADSAGLLQENETAYVMVVEGKPIGVELPNFVQLKVAHTEPGVKGDTATGAVKPATLETGAVVSVPLFVNRGDTLKIDTRTGDYVERVY